jgi:phosphatidylinositol alpha-mannosyltransferase
MKIALISPYDYFYPGGVNKHISHLATNFRRMGHDARIIAACSDEDAQVPSHVIKITSSVIPLPISGTIARITLSPRVYKRVKKTLIRESFDVIHLHEPMTPVLPLTVLRHAPVTPQSTIIGTFHAYRESNPGYNYGKPVLKKCFERLDGRIAVSEAASHYVNSYYPGEYVIIPNGIDLHQFGPHIPPLTWRQDERPTILFVGRLEPRKGFKYLLHAFPYVRQVIPNARMIVVGAYSREDKEPHVMWARQNKVQGVRFVGPVTEEDLPRYYRSCDVFCAPSTGFESFGIVLLEAMASGAPIVASDITGYRQVLRHEEEGLLVEPENEQALAQALITLLQNPQRRRQMGQRGMARAATYSWDRVARQVLCFYEEVRTQKLAQQNEAEPRRKTDLLLSRLFS